MAQYPKLLHSYLDLHRLVPFTSCKMKTSQLNPSTEDLEDLSHGICLNEALFLCYPRPLSASLEGADACASCRKLWSWAGRVDCEGGQA